MESTKKSKSEVTMQVTYTALIDTDKILYLPFNSDNSDFIKYISRNAGRNASISKITIKALN